MARKAPVEPVEEEDQDQGENDRLPHETLEEWVRRKNEEEGIGPDGHTLNESRHGDKWDRLEDYDPHLGTN